MPKDEKTYDALLRVFRKWLQERLEDYNLRKEQHRAEGKGDGKEDKKSLKSNANDPKGDPKGGGKKGKKGDGKDDQWSSGPRGKKGGGKADGANPGSGGNAADPERFCWFFQTEWNGGYRCYNNNCRKEHEAARTKAFYEKIPIPQFAIDRGLDKRPATPRRERVDEGGSLVNKDENDNEVVVKPDWTTYCKGWVESNFTKCEELEAGKCRKCHPDARQYNIAMSRSTYDSNARRGYRDSPRTKIGGMSLQHSANSTPQ